MTIASLFAEAGDLEAISSNLADNLSFRASSTGPKTRDLKLALLTFLALERRPFAILTASVTTMN